MTSPLFDLDAIPQKPPEPELKCCYCGKRVTHNNFGRELVTGVQPRYDLMGQRVHSWRIGNCFHCWEILYLVNGSEVIAGQGGFLYQSDIDRFNAQREEYP